MEQSNKELIKEIADLFEDYEESYVPGEWESFQKQQKKRYPFFPAWLKVAAVFLIIASVITFGMKTLFQNSEKDPSAVLNTAAVKKPAAPKAVEEQALNAEEGQARPEKSVSVAQTPSGSGIPQSSAPLAGRVKPATPLATEGLVVTAPNAHPDLKTEVVSKEQLNVVLKESAVQLHKDSIASTPKAKQNTAEFLLAESKRQVKKETKKESHSKWDFGLEVMPTATRTNMNFGGGIVTAYHISDKLALSSGVTLVQLGSGNNVPETGPLMQASPTASYATKTSRESRELLEVDATIRAIDIPLGLVYKLNKHYYTSAGVSYFNVITERRKNTYAETIPVNRTSTDPATGALQSYTALEVQQVDEPAVDRPLKGNSYLGFFNFSFGRRQTISKQLNIQVEPFIKVPIGKLSTQELNLMNSGVKLQLSF